MVKFVVSWLLFP